MNAYKKFGYFYDEVMAGMNYELWMEFIEPYIKKSSKVLDLACGSGTLCILMSLLGYNVEGLDLSESILEIAKEKTKINHQTINYYQDDMTSFNLNKKYDVITCFFDSINFLSSKQEIMKMLDTVAKHLITGGYFIFDVFSKEMLTEYENNIIDENYSNFKINWETTRINQELTHTIKITEDDETITEQYKEYYYDYLGIISPEFKRIKVVGDFNDDLQPEDERILVVLQKN